MANSVTEMDLFLLDVAGQLHTNLSFFFEEKMIEEAHQILSRQKWIGDWKVMQAHIDLALIQILEQEGINPVLKHLLL